MYNHIYLFIPFHLLSKDPQNQNQTFFLDNVNILLWIILKEFTA